MGVNSCTAGLHLALAALNIGLGDEVITTPLTFSFARRAYEEVYRQFCRILRVPEKIEPGSDIPMGVRLFDLNKGEQLGELLIPYAHVKRIALSPDGTFLAQTEPLGQDVQLRDGGRRYLHQRRFDHDGQWSSRRAHDPQG